MNDLSQPRVLVADDEEPIRLLVSRVLRRAGYRTVGVSDGEQAIHALRDGPYDAIVMDLMMPRVDGIGVMNHLIETDPGMLEKTVVMTAFPKAAAEGRLHQLCCIVSKPFELDELLAHVRRCVGR